MATKAKHVAVFIGLSAITEAVLSDSFADTLSASRAPYLGKRDGMDADAWREHCRAVFAAAETEETAVISAAVKMLMVKPEAMTVFVKSEAFGATDSNGKVIAYASIATPDAWRDFGGLARSMGATIRAI